MARYTGPKCRLCRREGEKLYLKGKRCESAKCPFEGQKRRDTPPGMAPWRRGKVSTYGKGLREKQKCKRLYGILEKPFKTVFAHAAKAKGNTGENLIIALERRLDNVVRRLGMAFSRTHARQLVSHGHVFVNDKRVDIPSYQVRPGDVVAVSKKEPVQNLVKEAIEQNRNQIIPSWLSLDLGTLSGRVEAMPTVDEMSHPLQLQLIVEICSR